MTTDDSVHSDGMSVPIGVTPETGLFERPAGADPVAGIKPRIGYRDLRQ